ncbi:site-specific integrase, partial [Salmonella enterica]|uniref:site-specific integrase n=1 Tax=Salmonella enterica TaxID=28901 RepID=UPI001CECA49C
GEIQEDWEAVWEQLDDLNLEGKIVALYGMGDQLGYGEWFLDALWLERNLAENTLSAYRRDLSMVVAWLHHRGKTLATAQA